VIPTVGSRAQKQHFLGKLGEVRENSPDVYSVTGGLETARVVAEAVRAASGTPDPAASDAMGVNYVGLAHEGFTALADERADLASELGVWIQRAHDRREARAADLARSP
jgi:hypothetical protein